MDPWGCALGEIHSPTVPSATWVSQQDALHAVSLKKKHRKQSYVLIGGRRCEKRHAGTSYSPRSSVSGHGCCLQWCYRTRLPQIIRIAFEHCHILPSGAMAQGHPGPCVLFSIPSLGPWYHHLAPGLCSFDFSFPWLFSSPYTEGFPGGSVLKNLLAMQEMRVQSPAWEDPLEE